jgi:hypothetical protein
MGSIERELNEYLFLEFGMEEEEEALISESWPFSLRRLGEIGDKLIFEFDDDDEPFFAIGEPYLGLLPNDDRLSMISHCILSDLIGSRLRTL